MEAVRRLECHDLYFIEGMLQPGEGGRIARELLSDPITQTVDWGHFFSGDSPPARQDIPGVHVIEVALRPGVRRLLDEARAQGLTLAIATTTSPANVDALLHATLGPDSSGWFACIGAGDVVPRKKPAPDIYHWVLQRLGLPASDGLAIEDSAPGARAACAAGLPVLATRSRYSRTDALPPVLADLDGLGEPGLPAAGLWAGRPWTGQVTLAALRSALKLPAGDVGG